MISIRMPDEVLCVALYEGEMRVRTLSMIHAGTVDEAMTDDLGVVLKIGPVAIHVSAHQALDIASALRMTAERVRDCARVQVNPS